MGGELKFCELKKFIRFFVCLFLHLLYAWIPTVFKRHFSTRSKIRQLEPKWKLGTTIILYFGSVGALRYIQFHSLNVHQSSTLYNARCQIGSHTISNNRNIYFQYGSIALGICPRKSIFQNHHYVGKKNLLKYFSVAKTGIASIQ